MQPRTQAPPQKNGEEPGYKVTKWAGGYSFGGRSRTVERPSVDGYSLAFGSLGRQNIYAQMLH